MTDMTFVKGEYGVTQPFDLTANNPSFSDAGTTSWSLKIARKSDINNVIKTITLVRTADGKYDWSVASGDTDLAPGEYILSIEGTGTSRKFKTATESPDWIIMSIQDDAG